jgi:hypothetical protein
MPAIRPGGTAAGGKHSIFLSYRRSDTGGYAFALFRDLERRFPDDALFYDKSSIESGIDFPSLIAEAVRGCSVLLAVISRDWLAAKDEQDRRRLEDPNDFVRREIALALELGKKVIPVLFEVDDKNLPVRDKLPGPLQGLIDHDNLHLRGKLFEYDVQLAKLVSLLAGTPGVPAPLPALGGGARAVGVRPDKLPYLCDRSEQELAVRDAVRGHLRERAPRPLVLVIHGRSNESHDAFVDRLAALELPRVAGAGLSGPVRLLHFKRALNFSLGRDEFARDLRERIAEEMQLNEELERDEVLLDRIGEARLGAIAPVIKIHSEERIAGAEAALRRLFEYWRDFPDSPRCLVACLLCVMYQGSAQGGFVARWLGRSADGALRRAVGQTAGEFASAARMTWKALPELESVKFLDVERWASAEAVRNAIYAAIKEEPTVTTLRARFGNRDPIPMDDAIEKMRTLLIERQGI